VKFPVTIRHRTSKAKSYAPSKNFPYYRLSYAFRGSPRQVLVLRAEGNYEDFARSGMSDFNVFIMEDFMGATFFHLLLGLVVTADVSKAAEVDR